MVRKTRTSLWTELTISSVARLSPACVLSLNRGSASTSGGRSGSVSGHASSSSLNMTPYWWGWHTYWNTAPLEPLYKLSICVFHTNICLCYLKCFKCAKDLQPLLEIKLTGCQVVYKSKHNKKMQHELKVVSESETLILGFQSCGQAEEWRKVWSCLFIIWFSQLCLINVFIRCMHLVYVSSVSRVHLHWLNHQCPMSHFLSLLCLMCPYSSVMIHEPWIFFCLLFLSFCLTECQLLA